MRFKQAINDVLEFLVARIRRLNPRVRDLLDATLRDSISRLTQCLINFGRPNEHLGIAEEKVLPDEEHIAVRIAEQMKAFLEKHYRGKVALRAGNTKTFGVVRGEFEVLADVPPELRQGVFQPSARYPAWVRFGGPGPFAPADVDDNGILSIGIKLMGVAGDKLISDERFTQDFLGISAPTFTTPNVVENLKLQRQVFAGTPVFYFINLWDSHLLDGIMQGLYAKLHTSPLEVEYQSCVPFLHGEGRAVRYVVRPQSAEKTPVPRKPPDDYLRNAMAATLNKHDVVFEFFIQLQTDSHKMPLENASVIWPERLSPLRRIATLRLFQQKFDSPAQLEFARNLSFNPWHALPEHRPLGNQNRARKHIYLATSKHRQQMNGDERVEPTGDETFS